MPPTFQMPYRQTGGRGLVFVNNPEFIQAEDLADLNGVVIHRETLAAGSWRVWSSLNNRSGADLAYRVTLHNPGSRPVDLLREAEGQGAFAHDFPAAWNHPRPAAFTLAPSETLLLQAVDTLAPDVFFGGLVDFWCSGALQLDLFCAREPERVRAAALRPMGYITRQVSPTHREARVYKGANPHTEAELRADWRFGDADRGELSPSWLTHITVGHRPEATQSDMFAFQDPTVDHPFRPDVPSDALERIPNFGNWGVMYHHHGQLVNTGARSRRLRFRLAGTGLHLACQASSSGPWRQHSLHGRGQLDWAEFHVTPGDVLAYSARLILGGPSNGGILHTVYVE